MRRVICGLGLVFTALAFSCSGDDVQQAPPAATTGGSGGSGGETTTGGSGGSEPAECGTALGELDEASLIELAHDDDMPATNVRMLDISVESPFTGATYTFADDPLHEAVRFELEHPAKIHGFKVKWAALPEGVDPRTEFAAGLYPDFGYNGFDFWSLDPLWSGTRCAEDIDDSGEVWTTYTFEQPVVVDHPGLVYVAHRAEPGDPVWWYDNSYEGEAPDGEYKCGTFDWCSSSFNLPGTDEQILFNGLSYQLEYDLMVRLFVEYTDDVQPEDTFFQPVADAPSNNHVAWADYDNDGYDDLLLGGKLHHNEGDGTFTDVTDAAGITGATGGIWGDYDNDGCLDVFMFSESYTGGDRLLHSLCDGSFEDVTDAAGFVDYQTYNKCAGDDANTASPTAAAAWFDLDADGDLDLYQANFICWADETFYVDSVYRNDGVDGFVDISKTLGFSSLSTPSRTVDPIDHDNDGDIDLFVGNYRLRRNLFFENKGDGTVDEAASAVGLGGIWSLGGYYGHTIGAAWGDLDNDGDFDNVTGNLAHPRFFDFSNKTQILLNDGAGKYTELGGDWSTINSASGLRYQETHSVPVLADFNNNGNLDLAITCVYDGRPTDFYWGQGDGTFVLDGYHAGITTENGWGVAAADYDHDGDMDLFASNLFENKLPDGDKGHWLQVRVVGVTANWAAIGATVRVKTGTTTRLRHVQGGTGKGGQDSMYLHFGLGDAESVDEVRVTFPGGDEVVYDGPIDTDQRVWLFQDQTTALSGWAPPQ